MKTTLVAFLAAGVALAMPATAMMSTAAFAGGYGYSGGGGYTPKHSYAPKPYYPKKKYYKKQYYAPPPVYEYNGDYPSAACYGADTYDAPSGYAEGCTPPPEWITYCDHKWQSFDPETGYYKGYDGYYHYCK